MNRAALLAIVEARLGVHAWMRAQYMSEDELRRVVARLKFVVIPVGDRPLVHLERSTARARSN